MKRENDRSKRRLLHRGLRNFRKVRKDVDAKWHDEILRAFRKQLGF